MRSQRGPMLCLGGAAWTASSQVWRAFARAVASQVLGRARPTRERRARAGGQRVCTGRARQGRAGPPRLDALPGELEAQLLRLLLLLRRVLRRPEAPPALLVHLRARRHAVCRRAQRRALLAERGRATSSRRRVSLCLPHRAAVSSRRVHGRSARCIRPQAPHGPWRAPVVRARRRAPMAMNSSLRGRTMPNRRSM